MLLKHIQNLKLGLRKPFMMECFNRLKAAGYKLSLTEILCQLFQKHDIICLVEILKNICFLATFKEVVENRIKDLVQRHI